jgi:replicative DNA helicase
MKRKFTIYRLLMLLLAALAILPPVKAQINTEQVINIGRNALYFEDYILAIQYFNQAIKAKSIASQEQAKATIENQTAIEKAEAKKKVTILNAEADAEQVRIAAEAEAEANHLIQESLTPTLIEKKKIEAWDGKLPVVSGNATSFINLDSLTKETKTKESEK